ncbi:dehydrogenase/reductase SDR family member 1-like, partial [Mobula birostris]|uniref:dehydrogenase/reductase SDR family member 1-like n=1 Tax=Mobula birostris TaxID=1983395 RepID=UPI003B27DF9A
MVLPMSPAPPRGPPAGPAYRCPCDRDSAGGEGRNRARNAVLGGGGGGGAGATMAKKLLGHICIVTGASRGIGKGIALQLGEAGATVYITGRSMDTLQQAAKEVEARGGKCVPVVCDSGKEEEVSSLFGRVKQEQDGRLDILVNNAYSGVQAIFENRRTKFWEMPPSVWDDINNVGLRGHYMCSVYGARMMVEAGRGLIVVISSMGGLRYAFSVPYGVGKAA